MSSAEKLYSNTVSLTSSSICFSAKRFRLGGFFDSITSVGASGTMALIRRMIKDGFNFSHTSFPRDMALRGFSEVDYTSSDDPLPGYLYRDYGFKIWRAFKDYVANVVFKLYKSNDE